MRKIYLIPALLFAISCTKESPKTANCIALSQGVADAFNFKTGSYWVYKDSASGATDSVVVTKYVHDSGVANSYLASRYNECYSRVFITCSIYHNGTATSDSLKWSLYTTHAFIDSNKFVQIKIAPFLYYPIKPESKHYYLDAYTVREILPTFNLHGYVYSDAVVINHKADGDSYNDTYHFVNGTGIVKMELKRLLFSGSTVSDSLFNTYELVRYHINH